MTTFNAQSTTDDVLAGVDLAGKRILVTGVSAGLGVETARSLAARGAAVTGTARDLAKARTATAHIPGIELVEMDLASLASVRAAADALNAKGDKFDVVIANAGVMAAPFGKTEDGFETQFGTNHLGHFVFVNRITALIRDDGRFVSLASAGHRFSDVDLDDPNFETTPYDPWLAYGRSKTANVLFAVEFDRRHSGRGVRAAAVHPGGINTELGRHLDENAMQELLDVLNAQRAADGAPDFEFKTIPQGAATDGAPDFEFKTIPQGAATSVWAGLVAPADEIGGRYCEDCQVSDFSEDSGMSLNPGVRPYALDPERARALWTRSETLVGETF